MNHVLCDGGLCNRLNALIFALVLRRRSGTAWSVSWPRNGWCDAPFEALFSGPLPVDGRGILDYRAEQHQRLHLMHENQVGFDADRLVPTAALRGWDDALRLLESGQELVYFNSLLPDFVSLQDARTALAELQVEPSVALRAAEFIQRHAIGPDTVGLHIRKTDFGSLVDDALLFRHVQASPRRVFVCSDDAEVCARFASLPNCAVFPKTAYPQKRVPGGDWQTWTVDESGRRFPFNVQRSEQAVVDGLIDLLILSRTEMLPTSSSTFLGMAGLFQRAGFFDPALVAGPGGPAGVPARGHRAAANAGPTPAPPAAQAPVGAADLLDVIERIRPWQMADLAKVRVGAPADGGYVLPASALRSNLVVSIGIGEEVSFDDEMAGLGCAVLQFDHTIERSPSQAAGVRFHRAGWGPRDEGPLISLATMTRGIDWAQARHPVLKFDVEGAEWEALDALEAADLARFEILTGEFHDFHRLTDRAHLERVRRVLHKLGRTHRVVHVHANNAGGMVLLGGIPMPVLLELTWMRHDAARFHGHSTEPIPGPLDHPNLPQLPDLHLRAF